ncbi:MAG: FtsX-like permease family protein [Acidobacteria bacterium]|nr:FtsX-like permease family protein [Acidobacteriota bacterium]
MREFIWRLRAIFQRDRLTREMEEEMRFHMEMDPLRAGPLTQSLETTRDEFGFRWLDGVLGDLRHAARALRRSPAFALVAVSALAAAVAINTLVFFLLDAVLLRPLPYPEPERLIRVYDSGTRVEKWPMAIAHYQEQKRSAQSISSIALYTGADVEMNNERVSGIAITPEFFDVLGAKPFAGRFFLDSEMTRAARPAIISHTVWRTHFHSDPAIVGKAARINRESWTIVGVAPPGFQHVGGDYRSPLQGETVGVWLPLPLDGNENRRRRSHFSNAVARLKPGVSAEAAKQELSAITERVSSDEKHFVEKWTANVAPLHDEIAGRSKDVVFLLAAAALLVMMIACANVAGLVIARTLARRDELAIRHALGASNWQLVRVGLTENLLLGVVGACAGLSLAAALLPLLRTLLPANFPRVHEVALTPRAAAVSIALAITTAIVAGLIRTHSSKRQTLRMRGALVAAEVGLACLLCAGGLLLIESYRRLEARDHGFQSSGVLTYAVSLPGPEYRNGERLIRVSRELRAAIGAVAGVESVGIATDLPWSGWDENSSWGLKDEHSARFHMASPGFFESIRTPLAAGRYFDEREYQKQPSSIIVNEALADRHLGGKSAIGTKIRAWGSEREIVGIVADVRDTPADLAAKPAFWFPAGQEPFAQFSVVVKTFGDPLRLAPEVKRAMAAVDPELPMARLKTLDEHAAQAMAQRRFALWLFQAFGVLAMALAAVGVYGLLAFWVVQRRKELGIRMALGATRSGLWRLVVLGGLRLAAIGATCAAALAPFAGRWIGSFLYSIEATDHVVLIAAPALLLVVALLASLGPAYMATRADPAQALRQD